MWRKTGPYGDGTISVFGYQCKYDLRDGFPLLTTKKFFLTLWFMNYSGFCAAVPISMMIKAAYAYLECLGAFWWWIRPVYGYQWRNGKIYFRRKVREYRREHIDQIQQAISLSRPILIHAYYRQCVECGDIDKMALPPCHAFIQFYVVNGRLDCSCINARRRCLGVPFNIAAMPY